MRALLFAYYFPPMGGIGSLRALGWARHLPECGVEVTVVAPRTGTYAHDESLVPPEGVRVVRTGTLEPAVRRRPGAAAGAAAGGGGRLGALARRLLYVPDSNAGWVPAAVRAGLACARRFRPDVVLSSSPPLSAHLAAAFTARRLRVPFVPDFRDFFETQRLFGGLRGRLDERIEARVLRSAAAIVCATAGVRDDLAARIDRPSLVVHNGYDEEDFAGKAEPSAVSRLVHVGSSYAGRRDPSALLGALRDLADGGRPVPLTCIGAPDPDLRRAVAAAGLEDLVEFRPFTTHAAAVAEMRRAFALLLFIWARDGKIARGVMAGRTFEYLRSGRPILLAGPLDGECARVLGTTGGAVLRETDDRAGLRSAVARLAEGEAPAPADPARLAARSRAAGARRFATWLSGRI